MAQNSDLFGTFLSGPATAAPSSVVPTQEAPLAKSGSDGLLSHLAGATGPIGLKDLLTDTSGTVTDTLKALAEMEELKLVDRAGDGLAASFTITDFGRELAPKP